MERKSRKWIERGRGVGDGEGGEKRKKWIGRREGDARRGVWRSRSWMRRKEKEMDGQRSNRDEEERGKGRSRK